ncbi:methyltransferase domain-containing protein [Massilia sp. R2A-15]|uniref:class I SAM-dependent methyltransferase n=1 Tax=Massilia sp. R2A-15 TaxID=3064278 RepID=UPI002736801B|nr:methyltransferase domain-containing protein [Massilia sp. R2A-15]WLI89201.1 methyltransferase domain-containing protein [Massilia sp. R2A-15]
MKDKNCGSSVIDNWQKRGPLAMLKYKFTVAPGGGMFDFLTMRAVRARLRASSRFAAWPFMRAWLRDPAAVGAICPSSARLARRIAQQVHLGGEGWVVELGAGTGVITAALLRHGVPADRLVIVERSPGLVRHLRARFPQLRVILGDAEEGCALINGESVAAVISGLPLRSLPAGQVARITQVWSTAPGQQLRVIQFTYALRGSSAWGAAGLTRTGAGWVWGNLPPARVDVFTRPGATAPEGHRRTA